MKGQTNRAILTPKLQRHLRSNMTDAERRLWRVLRDRHLDGCKFRRQHPYHDYILDFVCLERTLVVEVDGGQHVDSPEDRQRDHFLAQGGFKTLRFWNQDVLLHTHSVADVIYRSLIERRPHHPHPGSPLEGEGDRPQRFHQLARAEHARDCREGK